MVIEDETRFTPEELEETSEGEITGTRMINGVEFVEYEEENDTTYYLLKPNGYIEMVPLTGLDEFKHKPNYTFARLKKTGRKVMVDDEGVHREWE